MSLIGLSLLALTRPPSDSRVIVVPSYRNVTALAVDNRNGEVWGRVRGGALVWRGGGPAPTSVRFLAGGRPPRPWTTQIDELRHEGQTFRAFPGRGLEANGKPMLDRVPSRSVTALLSLPSRLLVATADAGVWQRVGMRWTPLPLPPDGLPVPDVVSLVPVGGQLWLSGKEAPVTRLGAFGPSRTGRLWRDSATWNGETVVRRADGRVVVVSPKGEEGRSIPLPRRHATGMFAVGASLFVAQQGGWSEITSRGRRDHFDLAPLVSQPTTAILATSQHVWVGTQRNGLVQVNRASGEVTHWHEGRGLTDDWITHLRQDSAGNILVGTFVGGLLRLDLRNGKAVPLGPAGGCIMALREDGPQVYVGTLNGVWRWDGSRLQRAAWSAALPPDVTDIRRVGSELWVAAGGILGRVPAAPIAGE